MDSEPEEERWVSIVVPGDQGGQATRLQQRSQIQRHGPFFDHHADKELFMHKQSYTLKGLKRDTSYEVGCEVDSFD